MSDHPICAFGGDEKRMRQVRTTLLRLMQEFARQELKRIRGG
jgi:hypothetical protein